MYTSRSTRCPAAQCQQPACRYSATVLAGCLVGQLPRAQPNRAEAARDGKRKASHTFARADLSGTRTATPREGLVPSHVARRGRAHARTTCHGGSPADVRPVGTTGSPGPRPGVPPRRFHAQQRPSAVPGARFEECKPAALETGRRNGQTGGLLAPRATRCYVSRGGRYTCRSVN